MKLAKLGTKLVGAIIFSGLLVAGSAFAGVNCTNATITKTGVYPYLPGTVSYAVFATCGDTTMWTGELLFFIADDAAAESFYAAALTGVSTGNLTDMIVTSGTNYGTVKMLSVTNSP